MRYAHQRKTHEHIQIHYMHMWRISQVDTRITHIQYV